MQPTLTGLADDLSEGRTSSRKLVEACLERIADPAGEGSRTFLEVYTDGALAAADAMDRLRAVGLAPSCFAGIPISVKDLFDIGGEVTPAGSRILAERAEPAKCDAPAIARLRRAGFVVLGRTNMTEFAFSGLGLNPHFGTPAGPYDRENRRIPGGSSSGAAVSVADGMAAAGIGTDTGGSCRIPAALCGIVGYKPTADTIPCDGTVPLSSTLDSIGSLANSVECCWVLHQVMSGAGLDRANAAELRGLRIAVPQTVVLDGLDAHVSRLFQESLDRLAAHGAVVREISLSCLSEIARMNAKGGFPAAEAYAWHREFLASNPDSYDPRVRSRILKGQSLSAADYIALCEARSDFVRRVGTEIDGYDLLAMPTVPVVAPTIGMLEEDDEAFTRINLAMLRNPTTINMMDGCAISLPMNDPDEAPSGLMLAMASGNDRRLIAQAMAVESVLRAA